MHKMMTMMMQTWAMVMIDVVTRLSSGPDSEKLKKKIKNKPLTLVLGSVSVESLLSDSVWFGWAQFSYVRFS